jgi:hypothetical protein
MRCKENEIEEEGDWERETCTDTIDKPIHLQSSKLDLMKPLN